MTEHEQDVTIEEFCKTHNACIEGRDWAIANCKNMAECWEKLSPNYLIWTATRTGVLSDKELRLFAIFCCREIWNLLTDDSKNAVEVSEKFANGQATTEELQVAADAADAAARAATDASDAARAAADAAAYPAAFAAARAADAAACAAAYASRATAYAADAAYASRAAAYAAAYAARAADAAYAADAAADAALQKQADWLRTNTIPNFKRTTKNDRN